MKKYFLAVCLVCMISAVSAQDNRIDKIRSDAPALAPYGQYNIGVTTLTFVHRDQLDIVKQKPGQPVPRYDRPLTCEVWYPAQLAAGQQASGEYKNVVIRDPAVTVSLYGKAVRDAAPNRSGAPIRSSSYPMAIRAIDFF